MENYLVCVNPPATKLERQMVKIIWQQLEKDLFFAVRAFDVSIKDLSFTGEQFILHACGKFKAVNDFITFILLRLSEKTRQVVYRSYSLLKA